MKTKIELIYHSNGRLEKVDTNEDVVFQGSVATSEFTLSMAKDNAENWLPSDSVFICFKRADGKESAPLLMQYDGGVWRYISNGWLEDVDLHNAQGEYKVSVLMRRYSSLSATTVIATRTSEQLALPISPSATWTPQDISADFADQVVKIISGQNEVVDKIKNFSVGTVTSETKESGGQAHVEANIKDTTEGFQLNMDFDLPRGEVGEAAGFDTPEISAETLPERTEVTAEIVASGPDTRKKFRFNFGIPRGQYGNSVLALKTPRSPGPGNEMLRNIYIPEARNGIVYTDDILIGPDGYVFLVTEGNENNSAATIVAVEYYGDIHGPRGLEGLGFFHATSPIAPLIGHEIDFYNGIDIPEGREVKVGDLVLDDYSKVGQVTKVSYNHYFITTLMSIKGEKGDAGDDSSLTPDGTYLNMTVGKLQAIPINNGTDIHSLIPQDYRKLLVYYCPSVNTCNTLINMPKENMGTTFYLTVMKTWQGDGNFMRVIQTMYTHKNEIYQNTVDYISGAEPIWGDWVSLYPPECSNPNLIANSNFLLNTRGLAEYNKNNTSGGQDTVDGLKLVTNSWDYTLTPQNNGGITIVAPTNTSADFFYDIPDGELLYGNKQLTLSINLTIDGETSTIITKGLFNTNTLSLLTQFPKGLGRVYLDSSNSVCKVHLNVYQGKTVQLNWWKLEIGSNATIYNPPSLIESYLRLYGKAISSICNPNILINSNFAINQRGETEYNNSNAPTSAYTVDRLVHYLNCPYKLTAHNGGGIVVENTGTTSVDFAQIIEDGGALYGNCIQTLSMSIVVNNVTRIIKATGTPKQGKTFIGAGFPDNTGIMYVEWTTSNTYKAWFRIYSGKTVKINWWKLEVGSNATAYMPPNPAEELLKCQRYYQVIHLQGGAIAASTANTVYPQIPLACSMRIPKPTLIVLEYPSVRGQGSNYDCNVNNTSITLNRCYDNACVIQLTIATDNFTTKQIYALANGSISLDAEL